MPRKVMCPYCGVIVTTHNRLTADHTYQKKWLAPTCKGSRQVQDARADLAEQRKINRDLHAELKACIRRLPR